MESNLSIIKIKYTPTIKSQYSPLCHQITIDTVQYFNLDLCMMYYEIGCQNFKSPKRPKPITILFCSPTLQSQVTVFPTTSDKTLCVPQTKIKPILVYCITEQ